jgi:hypothetical protein
MAYKRPQLARPEEYHNLQKNFGFYEQVSTNDPGWIYPKLVVLMDDGHFALHQLLQTIKTIKATDFSQFKDSVAKAKKEEPVLKARKAIMTFLAKHISKAAEEVKAVENGILRVTQPETPSDATKAMLQELHYQEVRSIIRNTDPTKRDALIRGNAEFIRATVTSPDPLISPNHLTEIRREFAFSEDPSLQNLETDTKEIYRAVRKRAAEINSTSVAMLIKSELDDPLPPQEHFAVFTPETDYERHIAGTRIQTYEREQTKIAKDAEFEEKEKGVNLDRQKRAKRSLANAR